MQHPPIDNPADAELRLVDVVARHNLTRIPLPASAFTGRAADYWHAIERIWDRGQQPTVETIHQELVAAGVHTRATDVIDIACLPLGYRVHVDDYVALILAGARRRKVTLFFVDAAHDVANGADPDRVIARLLELVDD